MTTLNDVSCSAGVSLSTVSYVLGNHPTGQKISAKTRDRVFEAVSELGYQRNELARAMVSGHNRVIGFFAHKPEFESVARELAGVLNAANEGGYFVKVFQIGCDDFAQVVIDRSSALRLAGAIVFSLPQEQLAPLSKELHKRGVALAQLDSVYPQESVLRVISNDVQGIGLAVSHLAELGHTRLGFIAGNPNSGTSQRRETAFKVALVAHRLKVRAEWMAHGEWQAKVVEAVVSQMLQSAQPPTALVCASDQTALVVIRTARQLGWSVPLDLSVVGYADLEMATYSDPPLTTVAQPFREMGHKVMERMLEILAGRQNCGLLPTQAEEIQLDTHLVKRASTALPRSG